MSQQGAPSTVPTPFLVLTSLACGSLIMVIEVLGSRVIGPFFGVSLFIWTSIITVAMIALAAGYAAGGIISDKYESPAMLYKLIMAAGVLTLLVPALKAPIIKICIPLGLRSGAFISSFLLFAPALFLLGMVSPYIIRLATKEMRSVGKSVGMFYAISTIGSVAGTAVTGFFLVAYLGVNNIFLLVGGLLIALSCAYFMFYTKKYLVAAALILPVLVSFPTEDITRTLDNGTAVHLVHTKDSSYANLKIVDYTYGDKHTREMLLDGQPQSGMDMKTGLSTFDYTYLLQLLPYGINPHGKNALVVGLGGGSIPRWYEKKGIKTDIVEIDKDVLDLAEKYFNFAVSGDRYIEDARQFFLTKEKKYDYIVMDAFGGESTPSHLLSLEACQLMKSRMTNEAVLSLNIISSLTKDNFVSASIIKTLKQVFNNVDINPLYDPAKQLTGNIVIIAYDGPAKVADRNLLATNPVHWLARESVFRFFAQYRKLPEDAEGIILTDNYNPLDCYDANIKLEIRKSIINATHWDILLALTTERVKFSSPFSLLLKDGANAAG